MYDFFLHTNISRLIGQKNVLNLAKFIQPLYYVIGMTSQRL